MEYKIIRSNRKSIAIIVREGEVIVRAPLLVPNTTIETFVQSKMDWITKKLNEYEPVGITLERDYIYIFGIKYQIEIDESIKGYHIKDNVLVINGNINSLNKLEKDLKKRLDEYISNRLPYYVKSLNIKTPPYKIRKYKRSYGRCNSRHELSFSTYLYHENFEFIDYVILHECCHIIHFNHSKAFYDLVKSIMPDYKNVIQSRKLVIDLDRDQ